MIKRRVEATGLTLAEVLIVVAVLAFLVLVLITFSSRQTLSPRMPCGTNLSMIGRSMLIYSNDYQDELPRAGGARSEWAGRVPDWQGEDRNTAYRLDADGTGGQVSISASLYLLVKYTEITPKSFVCGGDRRASEFKLTSYRLRDGEAKLTDLWDFGPNPPKHCSYAYQMLYGEHKLTVSSEPAFAVAADRNPWMDEKRARWFAPFTPDVEPFQGTAEQARFGNAPAHDGDGQNVMFLDTHVEFKKRSYCGLENDNIYTSWDGTDKIRGKPPKFGSQPADARDSLLVNDPLIPRK